MTSVSRALCAFFGGFGWPAYPENAVPDGAALPYITVRAVSPRVGEKAAFFARAWTRSRSYDALNAKVDQIAAAIADGASVPAENGCVWIYPQDGFAQIMPFEGDDDLKCAYLSMTLLALTD